MKISRTYRLSPATLQMIADLQTLYDQLSDRGSVSATEIIEIAVARWHGAESQKGAPEMYTIDSEKLDEVIRLFNSQVDPKATDDIIEAEITADWHEGAEHQAWIDSASPQEIVDWLASFYD